MGNSQPAEEDNFDPAFMQQHNSKMNSISAQYSNSPAAPGAYFSNPIPAAHTVNMSGIKRSVYLLKPSLDIRLDSSKKLTIQLQYHSTSACTLEIKLGMKMGPKQQNENQLEMYLQEALGSGECVKIQKQYNLANSNVGEIMKKIMKLKISAGNEQSEYSLKYIPNIKIWKVLMEIYTKDGTNYKIEDIYGGGQQGQQCIICFCEPSTTMVKPCNHLCLCQDCAKTLTKNTSNCPICRIKIMDLVTLNKS